MEWRCAWCDKPQEENDPPCDNCGHGEFEKAVVPIAGEPEEYDGETTTAWVCTECGHEHPKHTPPCDRCGNADLEHREIVYDEDAVVSEMLDGNDGRPGADVGYLDVLDWKLAIGIVGVLALVVVLALGYLGVVYVPGITPTVPPIDAPGNGSQVGGLSLDAVEASLLSQVNEQRVATGANEVTRNGKMDAVAALVAKNGVREAAGMERKQPESAVEQTLRDTCSRTLAGGLYTVSPAELSRGGAGSFDSESALAAELFENVPVDLPTDEAETLQAGVDVHVAPDGTVYLAVFAC